MAARCTFIFNPVLVSMVINDDNVEIKFKKYTKRYFGIDKLSAYALFHSKQPLQHFNKHIKNNYKNEKI